RASGASRFRHAAPALLGPFFALAVGRLTAIFGGLIIVELILQLPGFGTLTWSSAVQRDLSVLMAMTLLWAALYAGARLLSEAANDFFDPRPSRPPTHEPTGSRSDDLGLVPRVGPRGPPLVVRRVLRHRLREGLHAAVVGAPLGHGPRRTRSSPSIGRRHEVLFLARVVWCRRCGRDRRSARRLRRRTVRRDGACSHPRQWGARLMTALRSLISLALAVPGALPRFVTIVLVCVSFGFDPFVIAGVAAILYAADIGEDLKTRILQQSREEYVESRARRSRARPHPRCASVVVPLSWARAPARDPPVGLRADDGDGAVLHPDARRRDVRSPRARTELGQHDHDAEPEPDRRDLGSGCGTSARGRVDPDGSAGDRRRLAHLGGGRLVPAL
ncbi:MAG: ABC transporter permease subunit, partial [Myxococcales bacterium]|nr:ABC transporter permease subunit [Myxococcales bacterium]